MPKLNGLTDVVAGAIAWRGDDVVAVEMGWAKSRTAWETKDIPGDIATRLAKRMRARFAS